MTDGFYFRCERCPAVRMLLVKVRGQFICAACWQALGSLFPIACDAAEAFAAEQATRERMLKRGGTDRHLARSGKS